MGLKSIDRKEQFEAEEFFPVTEKGMTLGELLVGKNCHILLSF